MKNRPRQPKGVSLSTIRFIEGVARKSRRAIRRQFVAADRRAFKGGLYHE